MTSFRSLDRRDCAEQQINELKSYLLSEQNAEFRNQLTLILFAVDSLRKTQPQWNETQNKYLEMIEVNANKMRDAMKKYRDHVSPGEESLVSYCDRI